MLWVVRRAVTVQPPDGVAREFGPETRLDGGDILTGLDVSVSDLFEIRRW